MLFGYETIKTILNKRTTYCCDDEYYTYTIITTEKDIIEFKTLDTLKVNMTITIFYADFNFVPLFARRLKYCNYKMLSIEFIYSKLLEFNICPDFFEIIKLINEYDPFDCFNYFILKYVYNEKLVEELDNTYISNNDKSHTRTTYIIYNFLKQQFETGNICYDVETNIESMKKSICINKIVISKQEIYDVLNTNQEFVFTDNKYAYLKKNYFIETDLCENIASRLVLDNDSPNRYHSNILIDLFLSNEQQSALENFLNYRISILDGSAGTGKTYTIKCIIKFILDNYSQKTIRVISLTGRVVNKIQEDININNVNVVFSTVHRALNLNLFKRDNILSNISEDFLIIDEAAMIDINLYKYIFLHTNFNTHILLAGDYNQLESIGAGHIFKDLITSNVIKNIHLSKIFRQNEDSTIINNAYKVLEGKLSNSLKRDKNFYIINEFDSDFIDNVSADCIKHFIHQKSANLNEIQILTATRDRAQEINALVQKQNRNRKSIKINKKFFKLNDRVIHTKNNYELNVYNGEVGYVTEVLDTYIVVSYNNKDIVYNKSNISQLDLAYAITVHKAQGSEAKHVFIVLSEADGKMLNRNLLYTAVTRAKETAVIIAKEEVLNKAIQNKSIDRTSNISSRLKDFMSNKKRK